MWARIDDGPGLPAAAFTSDDSRPGLPQDGFPAGDPVHPVATALSGGCRPVRRSSGRTSIGSVVSWRAPSTLRGGQQLIRKRVSSGSPLPIGLADGHFQAVPVGIRGVPAAGVGGQVAPGTLRHAADAGFGGIDVDDPLAQAPAAARTTVTTSEPPRRVRQPRPGNRFRRAPGDQPAGAANRP